MILLTRKCDHPFKGCPTSIYPGLLSSVVPHWIEPRPGGDDPREGVTGLLCGHCMRSYHDAVGDSDVTDAFDARWVRHRYDMRPMTFEECVVHDVTRS